MKSLSEIWTPDKLGTWSIEKARIFGMPCVGAEYTSKTGDHYRMRDGARCMVCGQPAHHVHHEPNKGMGGKATFELAGHILRPALFALCERCHDKRHFDSKGDRLSIRWRWNLRIQEEQWADGLFLNKYGFKPHDWQLWNFGYYEIFEGDRLVKVCFD